MKHIDKVRVKATYQLRDMTDGNVTEKVLNFTTGLQNGIIDIDLHNVQHMVHTADEGLFDNGYEIVGMSSVNIR